LSVNFGHLQEISPELYRLGTLAERFFAEDANTSLIKSRQFGEYMVKECPSSNELRLFGLWKTGVFGSVCGLI